MIRPERITYLPTAGNEHTHGAVLYWMNRDQRVNDNWALLYAQEQALSNNVPLIVAFCLDPNSSSATMRQYGFILRGLQELESALQSNNISFRLLFGDPESTINDFVQLYNISLVVCEFESLKPHRQWKKAIAARLHVPLIEVDAHCIVPCRHASQKVEFGAYTIRPKINRLVPTFLVEYPMLQVQPTMWEHHQTTNWKLVWNSLKVDVSIDEVSWLTSGEKAANDTLKIFINQKLSTYHERRNNPNWDAQSNMSPYLHFGQISAQRIALTVAGSSAPQKAKEDYLEELIIRRELSDNFCFYNPNYDSFDGFPTWAKKSLNEHRADIRYYRYSLEEFEHAHTHDALWNAAQIQLISTGKMHGYMRMYWAKKILEWTQSPEVALAIAITLNDKYELDGLDANGYTGIAWSVGGVHDRAWFDRPVYGKIRYMNSNGCASKFDVNTYIAKFSEFVK